MKKLLLLMTLMICSTGCSSYNKQTIPTLPHLPKDAGVCIKTISSREYVRGVMDCSNMAYDLTDLLCAWGYDARILRYTPRGGTVGHAIVEVIYKSFAYYIDPTAALGREMVNKPSESVDHVFKVRTFKYINSPSWRKVVLDDYLGHRK